MQTLLEGMVDHTTIVPVTKVDAVAETLMQTGLVPNVFILDLNYTLTVPSDMQMPYPWNLPSRLFSFPIEVSNQAEDGSRRIGLLHPLLADHPFVKHVEATLDVQLNRDGAPNEYGYSKAGLGMWWHAVDLITTGHWRDLLETAQFTTAEHIARAVAHGMTYSPQEGKKRNGHLSTVEAREIMAFLKMPEPAAQDSITRECFMPPSSVRSEKGVESWPVNEIAQGRYPNVWGHILEIEAGWFAYDRAGYLGWTKIGRDRFQSNPVIADPWAEPPTMPEPEKARAVLADTLGLRPSNKGGTQLDLF
jgi:hypothetical protein